MLRRECNAHEVTRISIDKAGIFSGGGPMKQVLRLLGVCLLVCNFSQAQDKATPPAKPQSAAAASEARSAASAESAAKLPVRRVVLYKNGVGYFEHLGRVHGSQDVHIDFTSAQLNDVLKSLTVLDLAGGRITGVDYNSEAPLARRLSTLRLALGEKPSVSEFLAALRGVRLEVRGGTGAALTGKLLSVERKTRTGTNWTVETDEISLITDSGEVRSVDLNPTTSVRIVDHDLNVEIGKYLSLIASAREQDVRRMTISTAGTGDRNLYVSYISEVPIWKTTYRIVLPAKAEKKPLLQGWAIVDNTVGEDWNDVELSLVAGAPHSFIQQLSRALLRQAARGTAAGKRAAFAANARGHTGASRWIFCGNCRRGPRRSCRGLDGWSHWGCRGRAQCPRISVHGCIRERDGGSRGSERRERTGGRRSGSRRYV